MRLWNFSVRVAKEILRDPLTLVFGLGFPLVLLAMMSAIQANVPVPLFEIEQLLPGILVFGLTFMTLFSAILISKDRAGAFLYRLYTTPMTASDFILGYTLPLLPISLVQGLITTLFAFLFGLTFSYRVVLCFLLLIPIALFFIALGLLFGSLLNDKQVGGICGALLTNLTAFLSGAWFDLSLVGGVFSAVARALPFMHFVELLRAVLRGDGVLFGGHIWFVIGYTLPLLFLSVFVYMRRMKEA